MRKYILPRVVESTSLTLAEFYQKHNIDPEELGYLGSGDFGEAYSIDEERVLKITTSKNEFEIAKELKGNSAPILEAFAKIYEAEIIEGRKYIIMEQLDTDSSIEDLFSELQTYLDEQDLPIQYLSYLDMDEIDDMSDEVGEFMDSVDDIIRAYRYLGIEASDIRPENMGYSKDGVLKAFDIDDRHR